MNRDKVLKQLSLNNADVTARLSELLESGAENEKFCVDLIESEIQNGKLNKRPKKLPCEMLDKINFMCRKYMDRMVRIELEYDSVVDEHSFKMAVIGLLEKAHIFRSKVVYSPISPYWKPVPYHVDDVVTVSYEVATERKKEAFFAQEIPTDNNVQLKIHLFYDKEKTTVCYLVNHMCVDGIGFMAFIEDLCRNYTNLVQNGESPIVYRQGPRDFAQVYGDFDKESQKKAKTLFTNPASKVKSIFPYTPESKEDKTILTRRKIGADIFLPALKKAKEFGCSGNDLFITAYIEAYKKISGINDDESVNVTTAVDLRRHIKNSARIGYTNQVSFINYTLNKVDKDIRNTLKSVGQITEKYKNDKFMGLYGLPLLNVAYKSMIYAQAEAVVKLFYSNPSLAVSNFGVIKKETFSMAGNEPVGLYVSGAVKRKPCAVTTIGSLNGDLCLSISFFGTEKDREIITKFYDEFENALIEISK